MPGAIYDCIVLGCGGVGSAAASELARRGARVMALDQFPPGHDRGSSHGQSRAIRQAYFEHSDYVPLLLRAYELWHELESRRGERLYHETGLLEIGEPTGPVVSGVLASAKLHNLPIEQLSAGEIARRFPGAFRLPENVVGLVEQRAGYMRVEACVLAFLDDARQSGAEIRTGVTVKQWRARNNQVEVTTDQGNFTAGKLVIAAGAWAGQMLGELGIALEVRRKHLHWFGDPKGQLDEAKGTPVYFFDLPHGFFYGFPGSPSRGVKVACHSGGEPVSDPLTVDRSLDAAELREVQRFVAGHLPSVESAPIDHAVCMYTMTPDEHFIVDRHPEFPQVALAAGLSGHGFKFASVLGQVLADLALEGKTELPFGFLSLERPALKR